VFALGGEYNTRSAAGRLLTPETPGPQRFDAALILRRCLHDEAFSKLQNIDIIAEVALWQNEPNLTADQSANQNAREPEG